MMSSLPAIHIRFLLSLGAACFLFTSAHAQRPVSYAQQNRKVVLEQFTGINCATCPGGHRIADSLQAVKPAGRVFLVNIHAGSPAVPHGGDPDFRTGDGNNIANIPGMGLSSYPSGMVNRQRFGSNTTFAMSPFQWSASMDTILAKPASHNLAIDGQLNVATRELKILAEIFGLPSANATPGGHLVIMLLEDSVSGPQLGANLYPSQISSVGNLYKHNHVLRKTFDPYPSAVLTGSPTFSAGVQAGPLPITYTVPTQYINNPATLGNLRLLVFLAYGDTSIANAASGPITLTGFASAKDAALTPDVRIEKEVCNATLKPIVRIYNTGSQPITSATLESSLNGGPFLPASTFSGSIAPATSALVAVTPISFAPNATNNLKFKIVAVNGSPDANPANDTLTVSNILRTTRLAKGRYVTMRFTQDRFGAESTWQIVEESTGAVKLAGGPYPNLSNNGTALRTDSFRANPELCYEVVVKDGSANGINNGSGAGGYQVISNGQVLYASNGQFGARDRALFKTAENLIENTSGVGELTGFEGSISLSPNPAAGETRLLFTVVQGTKASVQVVDMTGRVVAQTTEQNLSAGSHALPIVTANLAGGVYQVQLTTAEGVVTRKLVVTK